MILVPEIETVVILVPRTGTASLKAAIAKRYPKSIALYRHMEVDGVPAGYDRWRKVGVVRNPIHRMCSLYKFLKNFDGPYSPAYISSMRRSVEVPFSDWVRNNEIPFTTPYDSSGKLTFYPKYTVKHPMPENRKSQFIYLRPDLGTDIYYFDDLIFLEKDLGIGLEHLNQTENIELEITSAALSYMSRVFEWDMNEVSI